ncbi:AAA family ATPase [Streptomyces sp. NPDC001478]
MTVRLPWHRLSTPAVLRPASPRLGTRLNHRILGLTVRNFRTLTDVKLPLGPLTVMVGPNAAGKSNVLHALKFLGDVAREGIEPAVDTRGGFEVLAFRGGAKPVSRMSVGVTGIWSDFASPGDPDRYELAISRPRLPEGARERYTTYRGERLFQHPSANAPTSIDLTRDQLSVTDTGNTEPLTSVTAPGRMVSVLQHPSPLPGGSPSAEAIAAVSRHLRQIRVFDPDVRAARQPSPISGEGRHLDDSAANLADFLKTLYEIRDQEQDGRRVIWENLLRDVRTVIPNIENIHLVDAPERADYISVELEESGLRGRTSLKDASFGTVRLLCLLAVFHDPNPPLLTCIEEIDHGIHPHALELLAGRLREASRRAQFLVTTHSPAFVDELTPEEFVVCERDRDGSSVIPAYSIDEVRERIEASEGMPIGELWFANTLGGGL